MSKAGKLLTVSLLTLGVPVPVTAAAVWSGLAAQRPLLATVLLTAYEGALLGIALVPRGPLRRRANQLVEAFDKALGRRVSRYDRQYRKYIRTAQQFVDVKGLGTVGAKTPELDRIFVHVGLARRPLDGVSDGVIDDVSPNADERYSIHTFLDHPERRVLVVLGVPGSGKTTLLHHVARCAADPSARKRRRRFPILLLPRDHSARIVGNPQVSLPELLRYNLPELSTKEPEGWWESQLHGGQCLILLDGLDEVARPEHRAAVTRWIERQVAAYPENDVVVTSRPHGYREHAIAGALVLQVRPFTDDQVRDFVYGWYRAAERDMIILTAEQNQQQAEEQANRRADQYAGELLNRLADKPELLELTVNPLLLTMIALVHRHRSALPDGRAELYREICDVMLWRRQEAKQLPTELRGRVMLKALAQLAFTMMEQQTRLEQPTWYVSGDEARVAITPVLRRARRHRANLAEGADEEHRREIADAFLKDVSRNGLLVELKHDQYAFAHHTIAEYLAAQHIGDHGRSDILVGAVDDVWWRETTLLYVAEADADPVVRACLDSGTIGALALAYECEELTAGLAPELGKELADIRAAAFSPEADRDRRRLVAGVLATSHFHRLVPAGNGIRICPHPVTTDLYYLFRRDVPGPYPDGAAELVTDPPQPVAGLWYSDAQEFVQWLNSVVSVDASHGRYRLPTPDELAHVIKTGSAAAHSLSESTAPVWTARANSRPSPELWFRADRSHPRTITGANIRDTATQDAASSPLLLHLSLVLALTRTHRFACDHQRALKESYDHARRDHNHQLDTRDGRGMNDLARPRTADLTLARDLAGAFAHDLAETPAHDLTQQLHQELEKAYQKASALDTPPAAPGFPTTSARDLELADDLVGVLDTALRLARELDPDCTRTLDDHICAADLRTIAVGPALAYTLADVQEVRPPRSIGFPATAATLVEHLMVPAIPDGYQARLTLERLHASLGTACTDFLQQSRAAGATAGQNIRWEADVAKRLHATTEPVFTRHRSVADIPPITVLLPAVTLAAEAADRGWQGPSKACREVAAGITLLARRASGEEPPEVLILARTT